MRRGRIQSESVRGSSRCMRELSVRLLSSILGALWCFLSGSLAAAQANAKNVLVLYDFSLGSVDFLESSLRARVPEPVNFYVEYMEGRRFSEKGYEESKTETLKSTYRRRKLDLVIVSVYPNFQFTLRHRGELFPDVPIVFLDIDARRVSGQAWPGVTGVTDAIGIRPTIDLAFRLHPKTTTVSIIGSNSDYEKSWLADEHAELLRDHSKVAEIDLVGLPTDQILERVAALPPQTVILFQEFPQASIQPAVGVYDLLARVGQQRPTYCIVPEFCLNHGGVGGAESGGEGEVPLAAELAARILSGERPANIPLVHDAGNQIRVDWRELHRWHIPESALPAGSLILYRPPTFWESYRRYVIAVIAVIAALLLLIAGLLWERARKRKVEARLRESEKRFRLMAETTPTLVWMCDAQGKITYLNERRMEFTGPDPEAGYGDGWIEYVHPDDVRNVKDATAHGLKDRKSFSREYRLRRNDGVYRWMFDVASPRLNGDGSFAGFIGSAIDVTDQKLAQQALEKVSGQLIEAQENERRRIARDLHDDICQRLALLSMELDQANRGVNDSTDATKYRLKEIRQHCSEIAGDVQSLSHELHSSRLDYLGIVAAIGGFCYEFSKQHEVSVEFTDRDVPADLPREISLCLFRVTQEALHNAVKYSGVSKYAVELTATAEEIQLGVSDAGLGFDAEVAKGNRGLGLVSMQERVHLVHGSLHVESQPGMGTKILAVVPLARESQEDRPRAENKFEEVSPQDCIPSA